MTIRTGKFRYIFTFTEEERRQIYQEERNQQWQPFLAVVAGILTAVATFSVQIPWAGQGHLIHVYATWMAVPAGIAAGTTAYRWMMWRQYRRWMSRWWSLAFERNHPRGWDTPLPERPATLLELTDRHIVHLNQAGATGLAVVACYLALAICGPALTVTRAGEVVCEVWLFSGWLVAALMVDRHFHH